MGDVIGVLQHIQHEFGLPPLQTALDDTAWRARVAFNKGWRIMTDYGALVEFAIAHQFNDTRVGRGQAHDCIQRHRQYVVNLKLLRQFHVDAAQGRQFVQAALKLSIGLEALADVTNHTDDVAQLAD